MKERRMNRQRGQRGERGSGCDRTGSRRKANLSPLIFVHSLILYQQKKKIALGKTMLRILMRVPVKSRLPSGNGILKVRFA